MTVDEIIETKGSSIFTVDHTSTIYQAVQVMKENKVGSIFVENKGKIVGIWTERDLLRNVLDDAFNVKTSRVSDYMTSPVKSIPHNLDVYQLMDRFLGLRLRHLPVKKHGKYIGVLSSGAGLKAVLNLRTKEMAALNEIAGWEYYENWGWSETDAQPIDPVRGKAGSK